MNYAYFHFGLAALNLLMVVASTTVGVAALNGMTFGFNLGVGLMHALRERSGK